jgi:hypothetical protein
MIALRRRAAACSFAFTLVVALCGAGGCENKKKEVEAPAPVEPTTPAVDRVAAAQARYNARPGTLAGVVDAAQDPYAVVSGIDPKSITREDVLSFIDVDTNQVINHGLMDSPSAGGRIYVKYDTQGEVRAPRQGDLCVRMK